MNYQALYRKYRPKNFNEVAGQNVTLKILKNAIKNKKVAHAYLFYGPRGTGKTSIAKIFAKTVNCLNLSDEQIPCGKCSNCIATHEKECIDIIEIDAASNNGVDEIRELKNKISFVPSELRYKVYIVDEVHMLSPGAFNALLKTLEEPPEHAIFVLATTELNKVPATIISRCQTLEFNKISDNAMHQKLEEISEKENINIVSDAIDEIVRYSNGGLRDAIGILEKANSYNEMKIDVDTIKEISGNISKKELEEFLDLYEKKDFACLIDKIDKYYESGVDLTKLINGVIEYLSNKIINEKKYNSHECLVIKELDSLSEKIRKSENPKIIFEVCLLNLLVEYNNDQTNVSLKETKKDESEKQLSNNNNNISSQEVEESIVDNSSFKQIRIGNTLCNPQKNIISDIRSSWIKLKDLAFDKEFGNIARLLSSDIIPVAASDTNVILISKLNGLAEQLNSDIYIVDKIFEKVFMKKYKVICISEKEWNEYIEQYKKDKNYFKFCEEHEKIKNTELTLKEKAKALFEDI